jgi:hypothetical protein
MLKRTLCSLALIRKSRHPHDDAMKPNPKP